MTAANNQTAAKKPAAKATTAKKITAKSTVVGPEVESTVEPTVEPTVKTPKVKLSYAQKLALMSADEAAVIRAKANEASRKSRAKKLGMTPAQHQITRLEKAVEKAKAKLAAATDDFDAALLALNTAKQEMEASDDEEI